MGNMIVRRPGSGGPALKVVSALPTLAVQNGQTYFWLPTELINKTVVAASIVYRINGLTMGAIWYDPAQKAWFIRQHTGNISGCTYVPAGPYAAINVTNVYDVLSSTVTYEE